MKETYSSITYRVRSVGGSHGYLLYKTCSTLEKAQKFLAKLKAGYSDGVLDHQDPTAYIESRTQVTILERID